MATNGTSRVGVVGAGAMGRGIAQVAAQAGHEVILAAEARDATLANISFIDSPLTGLDVYRDCDLVIEAIVEELGAKQALFRELSVAARADAVLATNTSSLSVASL